MSFCVINVEKHNYIYKEALLDDVAVYKNNIKCCSLAVNMGCCQAIGCEVVILDQKYIIRMPLCILSTKTDRIP
jgi:hypothetical protein